MSAHQCVAQQTRTSPASCRRFSAVSFCRRGWSDGSPSNSKRTWWSPHLSKSGSTAHSHDTSQMVCRRHESGTITHMSAEPITTNCKSLAWSDFHSLQGGVLGMHWLPLRCLEAGLHVREDYQVIIRVQSFPMPLRIIAWRVVIHRIASLESCVPWMLL